MYRNTLRCIATVGQRQGWIVLRYSAQPSHDTAKRRAGGALGAGAGRAGRWAGRRWARRRGARGASGWARKACAGSGTAWARGVQAGARAGVGAAGERADVPQTTGRAGGRRTGGRHAGPRVRGARAAEVLAAGVRAARARAARARQQAWGARPGRWARGLCAQAGPVGCSCTRLGFQPGFSTRYFS